MTLEELMAALAKKATRLKALVSQDTLTDNEKTEKRTLFTECTDLKKEIEEFKEERSLLDELDVSYVKPPAGGGNGTITANGVIPFENQKNGMAEGRSYREMFPGETLSRGDFKDSEEYIQTVLSNKHDTRLKRVHSKKDNDSEKRDSHSTSVGTDGGFSVPTEISAQWLDSSLPSEVVRPLAQIWPMASSDRMIPGFSGKDRSGGTLHGGFEMVWLEELGTGTKQKGKMELIHMKAHKGAIFSQISNELKDDGMGFAQQLELALKSSIGFGLDSNFINGNGVGKPQGVLSDGNPALIVVEKESSQAGGTINYTNLTQMYGRLAPGSYSNAVWLANQDVMEQLLSVVVITGTSSGTHIPVLKENAGSFSILGRPVIFTEHAASLGSQGDISLIDFSQYAVGLRKDLSFDVSNIPGWDNDATDYRVIVRVDGMSTWSDVVTPLNGTNTLSPFVTLAERS
jgi:HK97 family phage major capsid protein